jgi:peptidoglycan/LPS O-acetylase OafA/YrhL
VAGGNRRSVGAPVERNVHPRCPEGIAGPIGWSNLTWYAGVCALSIFASALLYELVEHPLERKLRGPR